MSTQPRISNPRAASDPVAYMDRVRASEFAREYKTRALALLDRCRPAAPEALRRNSAAAFEFVAATLRPDGGTFLVGDASGASPWEPETHPCHLLHLGAALFDRPDWKARAGNVRGTRPRTCLFFLMGLEAYSRWRAMPQPDVRGRTHSPAAFPDSGSASVC